MTVYMVGAGLVGTGVQLLGAGGVLSRSACAGAMGLRLISALMSPAQSNCTRSCGFESTVVRFVGDGAGSKGMGSVCMVLASTVLMGSTVPSPGSGLMGEMGAALVCAVQMGSTVMSPGTGLMGAGVGSTGLGCGVLCAMGLSPGTLSTSAAPSNCAGSHSAIVSDMAWAVGSGVRFRTSFWVSCITSCSPVFDLFCASVLCSLFPSLSSSVFCCLSLLPPWSSP